MSSGPVKESESQEPDRETAMRNVCKQINMTLNGLSKKERVQVLSRVLKNKSLQSLSVLMQLVNSIKQILHYKTSKQNEQEAIRSTLLSSICSSKVDRKGVCELLEIYQNRNSHKLSKYQKRREAYLSGSTSNMEGKRFASELYGFPVAVVKLMKNWFDHEECGTPDI